MDWLSPTHVSGSLREDCTWKTRGDRSRHQSEYTLVKHRFRNSVKDVQTLPGADIDWPKLRCCQDLHQIEESYKVPKEKTTIGTVEIIRSTTKSAGYSRRETRCNWMWKWECRSAVEQYTGMCVRYCQWSVWESREEGKKTMDYTGNDQ